MFVVYNVDLKPCILFSTFYMVYNMPRPSHDIPIKRMYEITRPSPEERGVNLLRIIFQNPLPLHSDIQLKLVSHCPLTPKIKMYLAIFVCPIVKIDKDT